MFAHQSIFAQETTPGGGKRIVAYYAEWSIYQRNYHVASIPADKLTHVNYAFAKIAGGECALFDSYAAIDKAYPGDKWDAGALGTDRILSSLAEHLTPRSLKKNRPVARHYTSAVV